MDFGLQGGAGGKGLGCGVPLVVHVDFAEKVAFGT